MNSSQSPISQSPNPLIANLFPLAATAVLLGYFLPWIVHPTAGLTFIGLDVSEWVKFLPPVQAGQTPNRDYFYLPPITLGLSLIFYTVGWPARSWRTWAMRGLGVAISLLAFPAIEAIRFEDASQWQPRMAAIGVVAAVALLSAGFGRWPWVGAAGVLAASVVGLLYPTWVLAAVRPIIIEFLQVQVHTGVGVWLNGVGHALLGLAAVVALKNKTAV